MIMFSAALLLFPVMDPPGNIPLFTTTLKKVDAKRQRFVVARDMLIALLAFRRFISVACVVDYHLFFELFCPFSGRKGFDCD